MTDSSPPPLLITETALATYLKAMATIIPSLVIWFFSNSFLLPKLEWLWQKTNLSGSQAQWLMNASAFLANSMQFVFGGVVLLLVFLELRVTEWPRYRRTVVSAATVIFHTTVLLGLTAISTSVLLAAPLLTRTN